MIEKKPNYVFIDKLEKDGTIKKVKVDFNKLPCDTCERNGHLCCPKPNCWNSKGQYNIY